MKIIPEGYHIHPNGGGQDAMADMERCAKEEAELTKATGGAS